MRERGSLDSDIFIPHNVTELYEKMISEHFAGQLEIESGLLVWTLPNGIVIKTIVENQPQEGYILVCYWNGKRETGLTHWHPMEDEIYKDLYDINIGQIFWVKKKRTFFTSSPLFMHKSIWEKFSDKRKNKYIIL